VGPLTPATAPDPAAPAGRVWLVTGSSAGLGRAIVRQLLAAGERVAATARSPEDLAELREVGGERLWSAALDLTDHGQIRGVVDRAVAELGRLDVVVSNAGYGLFGAAEEATDEQVRRQLETNLVGPIQLARAVLPHLRAQRGGRIVQVSSVGGQCTLPGMAVYHATKWGVEGFFESLAAEVGYFGIGVTIVEPGAVRTNFTGRSRELAPTLPAYGPSPAGRLRRAVQLGAVPYPGDVTKLAAAVIASVDRHPAPLRLALGSDAYQLIRAALAARLGALDSQRGLALSTDLTTEGVRAG